jgi:hypothetical protein
MDLRIHDHAPVGLCGGPCGQASPIAVPAAAVLGEEIAS